MQRVKIIQCCINFCTSSKFPFSGISAKSHDRSGCFFFRQIASFHIISSHFAPLLASVYKRSPGDGGQRCDGRPSPVLTSNLRLAPSLHLHPLLHPSPPLFLSTWLALVENSRCQKRGGTSLDQTRK